MCFKTHSGPYGVNTHLKGGGQPFPPVFGQNASSLFFNSQVCFFPEDQKTATVGFAPVL